MSFDGSFELSPKKDEEMILFEKAYIEGVSAPQQHLRTYRTKGELDALLSEQNIQEEDKSRFHKMEEDGWDASNVLSLMQKDCSEEQRQFANVFLEGGVTTFNALTKAIQDQEMLAQLYEVVNEYERNEDSRAWWGYAPYIYNRFMQEGRESAESLQRVFLWARDAHSPIGFGHDTHSVHLRGLEFLKKGPTNGRMYSLSTNPKGESHTFTRLQAEKIAAMLQTDDHFRLPSNT